MGRGNGLTQSADRVLRMLLGLALLATAFFATAEPVRAATGDPVLASISFNLEGFQDILLVESTDRLFLTGGATDDTLLVLDLDGNEITRKTGLGGVRQLVYDSGRDWVWVAISNGPGVRAYDASTGALTKVVTMAPGTCPSAIAIAGDSDGFADNEKLVVSSECDDRLGIVDLSTYGVSTFSGFPGVIQLATSPPPEQVRRFVLLDTAGVKVVSLVGDTPTVFKEIALDASTISASTSGARRIAVGQSDRVELFSYPELTSIIEFTLTQELVALQWTPQPAVVAVDNDFVMGFKPAASGAFWTFPIAPAVPFPNGIAAHSDGRIFVVATVPDGGGGGTGVIVPNEGEDPGSISGTVTEGFAPAAGQSPATLEVTLLNTANEVLAVDSVAFAGGGYSFDVVQPGTYHLKFKSVTGDETVGFFGERYNDQPLLDKSASAAVVVTSNANKVVDAELRPLFYDMISSVFYGDILWLGDTAITKGCNPPNNTLYCTGDPVTRGQMAAFLARALGLTDRGSTDFTDDNGSIFEADIEKLAAAGITKGCNPPANTKFCPDDEVTRGQMAAFLVRALGLTDPGSTNFTDDNGSIFEADIEKLAAAGITKGCNPPANTQFCPNDSVTRGQMAAFLKRAVQDQWPSE